MLCVCVNRHAVIDASDRVVAQHCLDDLQHRLVLEDLAILGLRQEPEPRARDDQVLEEPAALADQGHLFHDAVEIARGIQDVGVLVQSHSDVLAQQGVEVQVGVGVGVGRSRSKNSQPLRPSTEYVKGLHRASCAESALCLTLCPQPAAHSPRENPAHMSGTSGGTGRS